MAKGKGPAIPSKNKGGRPQIPIDADLVEKLASIHCTMEEIGSAVGCSVDTLERRFADTIKRGKDKGKSSLRRLMWGKAQEGNTTMMIWLSKQHLQMADKVEHAAVESVPSCLPQASFVQFCERSGYPVPYSKQTGMMEFVINGGPDQKLEPRLLLGARKYGKTDYATILGVAYKIYQCPQFTTIIVTKVEKNGRKFLREIARCLEVNGVKLEVDNADEIRVAGMSGKQSSVALLTLGSSGFRSNHPDLIIFDDPVVPGSVSETDRDQVKLVYSEAMKLTKNIALVGQPVDFRDLYQYLRKIIKTMEVPYGSIPELDDDLDLQRASGVDEKSIKASYFLEVEPEGDATFHDIQRIDSFPTQESIAFMDPSEGGDYTSVGIFTGHFTGMAIVGFAWKKRWDLCIPEMVELFKKFKVHKLGFETNKHGTQPLEVLRKAFHSAGLNISVEGKYTHSNKEARIQLASQFSKNLYLSKQSNVEYIRQVVEYAHDAKFDDSPDTIASFMEWAGKIRPPKAMKTPSKDL